MQTTPLARPSMATTIRKITSISTLPHVTLEILKLSNNSRSGAGDMEKIIQTDAALTSKLMKMVNSAHFSLREPVLDVRKAIVFLGFKVVKDIALAASVCDLFANDKPIGSYRRTDLWRHSVCVAIAAKLIAQKTKLNIQDQVFSTGILHDIGIIMIDQYLHTHFEKIMEEHEKNPDLGKLEEEILGFSHTQLGAEVATTWKLPEEFLTVIENHHAPVKAKEKHRPFVSIMHIADVIINGQQMGFVAEKAINAQQFNFALTQLNFKKKDIGIIVAELPEEFKKAKDLIELVEG
ncbi:MAG: HDOD domain-containing protein [Candidatus Cloacimonetes bacterium]|nr:HDOD domain-containing protein [Candidatus Cloacimonadota bacterium]